MLAKELTYTDFDGNERKETFYFNLTKAELIEMEYSEVGGFATMIQNIIDSRDQSRIISLFKKLVMLAYGEKSPDGKFFNKSDDIRYRFEHSQAYSDIFMELATNTESAIAFVNGIMPADVAEEVNKEAIGKGVITPIRN